MADGLIRPARPDEAAALTALAQRSKAHWGYDEALMAVFRRTVVLSAAEIAAHPTLVHETAGRIDAVGMLLPGDGEAELEHLWVDPPAIGGGVGRKLLRALLDAARRGGARRVTLNADPSAEGFYLHLGAVRIGDHPVPEIPGRVLPRLAFTLDAG